MLDLQVSHFQTLPATQGPWQAGSHVLTYTQPPSALRAPWPFIQEALQEPLFGYCCTGGKRSPHLHSLCATQAQNPTLPAHVPGEWAPG